MKLTKDEAALLSWVMQEGKYMLNDRMVDRINKSITAFEDLERRLNVASVDKRRRGRTTINSFGDIIIRFVKSYLNAPAPKPGN